MEELWDFNSDATLPAKEDWWGLLQGERFHASEYKRNIETSKEWLKEVQNFHKTNMNPKLASLFQCSRRVIQEYFQSKNFLRKQVKRVLTKTEYLPKKLRAYLLVTYASPRFLQNKDVQKDINELEAVLKQIPLHWICAGSFPSTALDDCKYYNDIDLFTIVPYFFQPGLLNFKIEQTSHCQIHLKYRGKPNVLTRSKGSYGGTGIRVWRIFSVPLVINDAKSKIRLNFLTRPSIQYVEGQLYQQQPLCMMNTILSYFDFGICRVAAVRMPFFFTKDEIQFCRMSPYKAHKKHQVEETLTFLYRLRKKVIRRNYEHHDDVFPKCLNLIKRKRTKKHLMRMLALNFTLLTRLTDTHGIHYPFKNDFTDNLYEFKKDLAHETICEAEDRIEKYMTKTKVPFFTPSEIEHARKLFIQDFIKTYKLNKN